MGKPWETHRKPSPGTLMRIGANALRNRLVDKAQKAVAGCWGIPFWGIQSSFKPLTLLDPDMIWYMIYDRWYMIYDIWYMIWYDMIQIFIDILMIQIFFEWLSWSTGIQTNKNYRMSSCHPQFLGFKQKRWFKRDQDFQNTNNSDFHSTVDSKFHGTHLDGFIFWVCKV